MIKASRVRYFTLGETPACLLSQARYLAQQGQLRAALMVCRLSVEKHLRKLAVGYGVQQSHTLDELAARLKRAKHLGPVEFREVRYILKTCNRASHGDSFAPDLARSVLSSAQSWLDLHPLPQAILVP